MEAFWILLICLVALVVVSRLILVAIQPKIDWEKIKEEADLLEQNYKKEMQEIQNLEEKIENLQE